MDSGVLTAIVSAAAAIMGGLFGALVSRGKSRDELKAKLAEYDANLRAKLAETETARDADENRATAVALAAMQQTLNAQAIEIGQNKADIERAMAKGESWQKRYDAKAEEKHKVQSDAQAYQLKAEVTIGHLTDELEHARDCVRDLTDKLAEKIAEVDKLEARIKDMERHIKKLESSESNE